MNIKEIKELIETVCQNGITELEVERSWCQSENQKGGRATSERNLLCASIPGVSASHVAQPVTILKDGSALGPSLKAVGQDDVTKTWSSSDRPLWGHFIELLIPMQNLL